ncbi:MAG: hypothetical protein Q9220_000515 [cf. Caloplaca sp. 1 TL-2023]
MPGVIDDKDNAIQQDTNVANKDIPSKKTYPCTFPRGSTPPTRSLFQTIITIHIGPSKTAFLVHRELFCAASPFFAAALNPSYNFRESQSQSLHLPSVRPDNFQYLVQWIYTRTLSHEDLDATQHPAYFRLIRLWALADELQVEGCRNGIVDFMAVTADRSNSVPTPDDTRAIFGSGGGLVEGAQDGGGGGYVREGSPLRRLVVDLFAYKKTDHLVEEHEDSW